MVHKYLITWSHNLLSEDTGKIYQKEVELNAPDNVNEMHAIFAAHLDKTIGAGKWKFEYYMGVRRYWYSEKQKNVQIRQGRNPIYVEGKEYTECGYSGCNWDDAKEVPYTEGGFLMGQ